MTYHLDFNNIYNIIGTDLNIVNRFLAHYILNLLNIENIKIRNQFHNFQFQFRSFISSALL